LIVSVAKLLGLLLGLAAAFNGYKELAAYLDRQWHWGESISGFILEHFPQRLISVPGGADPESIVVPGAGTDELLGDMVNGYAAIAAREMAGSVLELVSFIILVLAVYILVNIMMRVIS